VNRQIAPKQNLSHLGKVALARARRFPEGTFHLVSQPPSATQNYFLFGCPAGQGMVQSVLVCWGLRDRPQTPPPEAWPLDSITLALALTLRALYDGGKESVTVSTRTWASRRWRKQFGLDERGKGRLNAGCKSKTMKATA